MCMLVFCRYEWRFVIMTSLVINSNGGLMYWFEAAWYLRWNSSESYYCGGGSFVYANHNSRNAQLKRIVQQGKERNTICEVLKALGDPDKEPISSTSRHDPAIAGQEVFTVENINKSIRADKVSANKQTASTVQNSASRGVGNPRLAEFEFLSDRLCSLCATALVVPEVSGQRNLIPSNLKTTRSHTVGGFVLEKEGHELQNTVEQQRAPSRHAMAMEVTVQ